MYYQRVGGSCETGIFLKVLAIFLTNKKILSSCLVQISDLSYHILASPSRYTYPNIMRILSEIILAYCCVHLIIVIIIIICLYCVSCYLYGKTGFKLWSLGPIGELKFD